MDYKEKEHVPLVNKDFTTGLKKGRDLLSIMSSRMKTMLHPDVEVTVGDCLFGCNMLVLQSYSKYLRRLPRTTKSITLDVNIVAPRSFVYLYDWMLADHARVTRIGIIELYRAAKFLEIEQLERQCFAYMDDRTRFMEATACMLYYESINMEQHDIRKLMLPRISKFFLIAVAFKDFLILPFEIIFEILSSSTIAVHSEIEILYTAIRWLGFAEEKREQYIFQILECVRFTRIPPVQLIRLSKTMLLDSDEDPYFIKIMIMPRVQSIVLNTTTFLTMVAAQQEVGIKPDIETLLKNYKLKKEMFRLRLTDDEKAIFHYAYTTHASYNSFKKYLRFLRDTSCYYYKNLHVVT